MNDQPKPATGSSGGDFTAWDGSLTPPSATNPTTGEQEIGDEAVREIMASPLPPPTKPAGEWWAEIDADGCWHIGTGDRGFADLGEGSEPQQQSKIIADAHNAALSDEDERLRKMWEGGMIELERQLSAEKEKVQPLVDALKRAEGAIRSEDHVRMGLALVVIRDRLAELAKVKEPSGLKSESV